MGNSSDKREMIKHYRQYGIYHLLQKTILKVVHEKLTDEGARAKDFYFILEYNCLISGFASLYRLEELSEGESQLRLC